MTDYAIGQRVARLNDGSPGVVTEVRPKGNVGVRWDVNGLQTVVTPLDIRPQALSAG